MRMMWFGGGALSRVWFSDVLLWTFPETIRDRSTQRSTKRPVLSR